MAWILLHSKHEFTDKHLERMDTQKNKTNLLEAMEEAICKIREPQTARNTKTKSLGMGKFPSGLLVYCQKRDIA